MSEVEAFFIVLSPLVSRAIALLLFHMNVLNGEHLPTWRNTADTLVNVHVIESSSFIRSRTVLAPSLNVRLHFRGSRLDTPSMSKSLKAVLKTAS